MKKITKSLLAFAIILISGSNASANSSSCWEKYIGDQCDDTKDGKEKGTCQFTYANDKTKGKNGCSGTGENWGGSCTCKKQ